MGVWIAAAAVAAGAAISASGSAANAEAIAEAQKEIEDAENAFAGKWTSILNDDIKSKEEKLYNLGNIFDRFESTGAFGDTNTLENLRKAQNDFSALAAGDFSGFESQLRKTLSDTLINTVGSGAPVGTFAGLAADQQMQFRLQGVETSANLSEFFSGQANQLLGLEFGIMDQRFDKGYNIDRNRLTSVNAAQLGQANTEGIAMQSWGGALQTAGSAFMGAYTRGMSQKNIETEQGQRQQIINGQSTAGIQQTSQPYYSAPSYTPSYQSSYPSNNSFDYPDGIQTAIPTLPGGYSYDNSAMVLPPRSQPYQSGSSAFTQQYGNANYGSSSSIMNSLGARITTGG